MLWLDTSSSSCKAINLRVVSVDAKFDETTQTLIHILVHYVGKKKSSEIPRTEKAFAQSYFLSSK